MIQYFMPLLLCVAVLKSMDERGLEEEREISHRLNNLALYSEDENKEKVLINSVNLTTTEKFPSLTTDKNTNLIRKEKQIRLLRTEIISHNKQTSEVQLRAFFRCPTVTLELKGNNNMIDIISRPTKVKCIIPTKELKKQTEEIRNQWQRIEKQTQEIEKQKLKIENQTEEVKNQLQELEEQEQEIEKQLQEVKNQWQELKKQAPREERTLSSETMSDIFRRLAQWLSLCQNAQPLTKATYIFTDINKDKETVEVENNL